MSLSKQTDTPNSNYTGDPSGTHTHANTKTRTEGLFRGPPQRSAAQRRSYLLLQHLHLFFLLPLLFSSHYCCWEEPKRVCHQGTQEEGWPLRNPSSHLSNPRLKSPTLLFFSFFGNPCLFLLLKFSQKFYLCCLSGYFWKKKKSKTKIRRVFLTTSAVCQWSERNCGLWLRLHEGAVLNAGQVIY